jgi:hypothetical protein
LLQSRSAAAPTSSAEISNPARSAPRSWSKPRAASAPPQWTREPALNRTEILYDWTNYAFDVQSFIAGTPMVVAFDGIYLDSPFGDPFNCYRSSLNVTNSVVRGKKSTIAGLDACTGAFAGNLFLATTGASGNIWTYGPPYPEFAHNLVVVEAGRAAFVNDGQGLGGGARFNTFIPAGAGATLATGAMLLDSDGNALVPDAADTDGVAFGLPSANAAGLAYPPSIADAACDGRPSGGDVWTNGYDAPSAPACFVEAPLPTHADPLVRAALKYDRHGFPRHPERRAIGPVEHPDPDGDGIPWFRDACPFQSGQSCAAAAPLVVNAPDFVDAEVGVARQVTASVTGATGPVTFSWSQIYGPPAQIVQGLGGEVNVTAADVTTIALVATASESGRSARKRVLVNVFPAPRANGTTRSWISARRRTATGSRARRLTSSGRRPPEG